MTDLPTATHVLPGDIEKAVSWIHNRWGYQKAWEGHQDFAEEYFGFTVGALREALQTWWSRGTGRAPRPDELHKLVSEVQVLRVNRGVDKIARNCGGDHVWADPLPTDAWIEGGWVRTCVLCGETRPAPDCPHHAVYQPGGRCPYCLAKGATPKPVDTIEPAEAVI